MKTVLNVKMEKELKDGMTMTANEMGLPLSTIISNLCKRFMHERSVTFDAPLKPSKRLEKVLKQGMKDVKAGRNMSPLFTNMAKMDKYLRSL